MIPRRPLLLGPLGAFSAIVNSLLALGFLGVEAAAMPNGLHPLHEQKALVGKKPPALQSLVGHNTNSSVVATATENAGDLVIQ